jgi:L,D-transpeptidase catalytic domain
MPRSPLLIVTALGVAAGLAACQREAPPGDPGPSAPASAGQTLAGNPTLPDELRPKTAPSAGTPGAAPDAGAPEWAGPWLVITQPAAAVYATREFDQKQKIGYVRNGGKIAVRAKPQAEKNCSSGWYQVVSGGWVCGNLGTTDMHHPQVKFAIKQPNWDEVLPYPYARNAKNGTPLYRSVPSHDQMAKYEPYLAEAKAKRAKEKAEKAAAAEREKETSEDENGEVQQASLSADPTLSDQDGGTPSDADGGTEDARPWWQQPDAKDKLHELTLDKLKEDSDDIMAMRLVTGFYIAVDKTFSWNGRTWYKSTKGLIAPADRFWLTQGSKFSGVEIDGTKWKLPIAWVYGGRKTAPSYEIDPDTKKTKPAKAIDVFTPIQLTGKELEISGIRYSETKDGVWVKNIHVRVTHPGPPPSELAPGERWVDVNLKQQTLVVFEGTTPIYATLVSSGKESSDKDKDHRTPTGQWRIREKHVTTTMDGDGTAAGDLPYSIEDVPYVMYFDKSYALHGAFWHRNFGVEMSHGCVNLAPLDAKWVFRHTNPPLPEGWHGAWSSSDRPGSWVMLHD